MHTKDNKKANPAWWMQVQSLPEIVIIRQALMTLIPVVIIGSMALIMKTIPELMPAMQPKGSIGHWILECLELLYQCTFGLLSVYMTASMGFHIGKLKDLKEKEGHYGNMVVCLGAFFIFTWEKGGIPLGFGPEGMFFAIFSPLLAAKLFGLIYRFSKRHKTMIEGVNLHMSYTIHAIFPAALTLLLILNINILAAHLFDVPNVYELMIYGLKRIYINIGWEMGQGLFYTFICTVLWFFGIHGGNVMEGLTKAALLEPIAVNQQMIEQGLTPTAIVSKPFFDSFVLMGGCGTTLCLLLAILIFGKRKANRKLSRIALLPMIFNVNEIMLFGLPVVLNPNFLFPFLLTPLFCLVNSYAAMALGLVPVVHRELEWITPVFLSGYLATGSVSGAVLQAVNLAAGVMIYLPFVRRQEQFTQDSEKTDYEQILKDLQQSEKTRIPMQAVYTSRSYAALGKALSEDLAVAIDNDGLELNFQPQYRDDDTCVGAEVLLRWKHPALGWIYPPLISKLAEETGQLEKLEEWVIEAAIGKAGERKKSHPEKKEKISVNVSGYSIQKDEFEEFLDRMAQKYPVQEWGICLEITEQAALQLDVEMRKRFTRIREKGYLLAIDDFSMGNTSIQYLTGNSFNILKLDGTLVRESIHNQRCAEVIASIIQLARTLGMEIVAEYVSDEEIRDKMKELGCTIYQGWFYSKALTWEEWQRKND